MSFGYGISDFLALSKLAWDVVQNSSKACGAHADLTREARSLHIVLQRLELEIGKPESLLNRKDDNRREELTTLCSDCNAVLRVLLGILGKYNALSDEERSAKRLWQKVRFGNGEMQDLSDIRLKISTYTSALNLFVNLLSIGSQGRVEQSMDSQGPELKEIKTSVNWIAALLQAKSTSEGSILTSYTDDKELWRELRRELIKEGFPSSVVRKHRDLIKKYVKELETRGVMELETRGMIDEAYVDEPAVGGGGELSLAKTPRKVLDPNTQGAGPTSERGVDRIADDIVSLLESKSAADHPVRREESEETDSDFSVTSLETFATSAIASSVTSVSDMAPVARDSTTKIANLISNDHPLRELLDKAFDSLDPEKVTRNFRRALRLFSQELLAEAGTQPQEQAAKFVGEKARRIAVLIRENLRPSDCLDLPNYSIDSERQNRLLLYLAELQTDSTQDALRSPTPDVIRDDDSDEDENEHDDPDYHPDLTELRKWFLSANAMQSLRDRFRLFLYPEKPATLENYGDKAATNDSETQDLSRQVQLQPQEQKDNSVWCQEHEQGNKDGPSIEYRGSFDQPYGSKFSIPSAFWNSIDAKTPLQPGYVRLEWTCNCGHASHDDFEELRPGAVAAYAEKLVQSGYATHAQSTNQAPGAITTLLTTARNKAAAIGRNIPGKKLGKQGQNLKAKARKFAEIQCSPSPTVTCRWLHLCLKQRPNAKVTKLEPLHICKDDEGRNLTDASFFKIIRRAWKRQRTWTDLILFKLVRIEFVKFSAFPEDSVDRIVTDRVPPTTEQYDFAPPPPLEMVPPIAADHMVHLVLTKCTPSMQASSFYLEQLPKKKDKPLKFAASAHLSSDINIGYGLRFLETPDPSVIVTFLFVVTVVVVTLFTVFWAVFKKDLQDAFTVAACFVSVMALAVVTWQIRATS